MNLSDITDIAASGLSAQRVRMAVTASNLANSETTRTAEGGPYRRRDPVFRSHSVTGPFSGRLNRALRGVEVRRIAIDETPATRRHDPSHPEADADGFVLFPNISVVDEMSNLMTASRAYEANLVIIRKVRAIAEAALRIGR